MKTIDEIANFLNSNGIKVTVNSRYDSILEEDEQTITFDNSFDSMEFNYRGQLVHHKGIFCDPIFVPKSRIKTYLKNLVASANK